MKRTDSGVRLSATDLSHFLSCRHLTALNLAVEHQQRKRPHKADDPLLELLWQRGLDHEKAYVDTLRNEGRQVVEISRAEVDQALAETSGAIRSGAEVIVQAALAHESWFGYADVLVRIDKPSDLGNWSYEVIDTKLARDTRAGTVLQLGLYSAMLAEIQGLTPEQFYVVVPGLDGSTQETVDFRVDDFGAYFRLMQQDLLTAAATAPDELARLHYPEPVDHCSICTWRHYCNEKRHADDHLSLVAFLSRVHRRELESRDIDTLTKLASMAIPVPFKPKRGSRESYERAHHQALVQLQSRTQPTPAFEFRPPEPVKEIEGIPLERRGFARLPEPSPGDVFLDLEGDAFADEGGREYLFGIVTVGKDGRDEFLAKWAFTAGEERVAFEEVMDFIIDRLDRYPDMHVYHYAPYEPSAFKKLMGRHGTREAELDRLLRGGRFIDLYGVVRQALWMGVESYSIKRLEAFYGYKRDVDLPDAGPALRRMELALQLRQPSIVLEEERELIAGYNRDDCVSTLRLRDWLEVARRDAEAKGIPCPRPPAVPDAPTPKVNEKDQQILVLRERLIDDLPDDAAESDDEEHARWLLAFLLDYHRREEKATWWEFFRLRDLPSDDFYDERQAVAGLTFKERVSTGGIYKNGNPKGPVVDRYDYPEQDMDIDRGDSLNTTDGKKFAECDAVDRVNRTIDISKSIKKAEIHPTAVFAWDFIPAGEAKGALLRLGERVAAAGTLTAAAPAAAIELLLRRPPRLSNGSFVKAPGESELAFAIRAGANLDRSVLAIQGPPGSGKTFTGSEMIVELVKQGKRVGVTANSHKVIRNLLDKVVEKAAEKGVALTTGHKNGDDGHADGEAEVVKPFTDNAGPLEALMNGEINVLGGTHWLWSREDFAGKVDVLFVDEAGQMVLANALAVSQAADSIVLLGDPQQLDQPQQGSHPDGVAVSALEHLLGEDQTIPDNLGIFLPTTYRMSPALCALTSELYYKGRLHSRPGLENQRLVNAGGLTGSGLWYRDVEHDGNRNHSLEEVAEIATIVNRLTSPGVMWQDADGASQQLTLHDVLIVTPYNTQVKRLEESLGAGARIGTVDKFQGQQAPIVIYSMATSRPEDAPRGMEFLYNPNRLNVATSRAQCTVILVASPHLFRPECRTVKQMKLANGLCRFRELAVQLSD